MGFTARIQLFVLASQQLGQAWQWETRRQMVEVQELCYRQREQDSMCDLWAEKIVRRCRHASRGPVSEERSGRQAGKPRSSTPGGSGIQACSGSCRKGLSSTYGSTGERRRLPSWQGEAGQLGSGIEGNAKGRRRFRERESVRLPRRLHGQKQAWPRTSLLVRASTQPEDASHARSSERRKPWRWLSEPSRSQTWRSHAPNANCTTWKLRLHALHRCQQRSVRKTPSTQSVDIYNASWTSLKRILD